MDCYDLTVIVQRVKMFFNSSVINPQKLVGGSGHINVIRLALGAFLVKKLIDRLIKCGQFDGMQGKTGPNSQSIRSGFFPGSPLPDRNIAS